MAELASIVREKISLIQEGDFSKNIKEGTSAMNHKLNLLSEEKRQKFLKELIGILEFKDRCVEYGAKDPVHLPPSDVLTIQKNLYCLFYSS